MRILKIFLMVSILSANVFSSKAFCQPQESTLSAKAEDNFRHGLAAAKSQKWDMALKYFTQAQEEAPYNPQVLFNLGLAYEKAGFEIFAIAWLHAYLAAAPGAENTAAVEQEIVNLEIASESKAKKSFVAALEIYKALPEEKKEYGGPRSIFTNQAKSGDIDGAVKTATSFSTITGALPYTRETAISDYAVQLVGEGNLDAARDLLDKNPGVPQDAAMKKILDFYLGLFNNDYDVDEAKKVLAASRYKSELYSQRLINGYAVVGRFADAIALLEELSSNGARFEAWVSIGKAQIEAGKIADAKKSLQAAALLLPGLKSTSNVVQAEDVFVNDQIAVGDLAAAMDTINKKEPGFDSGRACVSLAVALVKQGKASEAKNWIAKVSDENSKLDYYLQTNDFSHAEAVALYLNQHPQFMFGRGAIAYAEIQALKFKDKTDFTCQDTLAGLPKFDVKNDYFFKWLSCFFSREGNIPQAQKILDCITSRDPMYLEMALYEIIGKYLGKGDLKNAGSLLEKYNGSFFQPEYHGTWLKMWFSYIDACLAAGKIDQAIMGLKKAKMVVIASGRQDSMGKINKRLSDIKATIPGDAIAAELWVGMARDLKNQLSLSDPKQYFANAKSDQEYLAIRTSNVGVDMAANQRRIKRIEKMLKESF